MSARPELDQGKELDASEWSDLFEGINRRVEGGAELEATIELVSDRVVGTEAERLPLNGITHEDGDDQIAIGVGGRGERYPAALWHFIDQPRRVFAIEDGAEPHGIVIESEDETLTVVRFYDAND